VLDSQTDSSDAVQTWAAHLDTISGELQRQDTAVAGVLQKGAPAADEVRALFDRLRPTLPILLANLVNINQVAITYQPNLEQLLVLLPQGAAVTSATGVANRHTPKKYTGAYLSFNLNLNLPPPCATGYLPAQQKRVPADVDAPDRPAGDLYCRIPQDSGFNVRGVRNVPCETVPGKRAPTVKLCESNEVYQPLNDGYNWKGDPNATLSGQAVPQLPPGSPPAEAAPPVGPAPPPIAAAEYDPNTGTYVGPDGQIYTQANLARGAAEEQTWQTMLLPPKGN
jgi:phospholipid/cholesterol/gamma-HCH transport system substrate-binding protein